MATLWFVEPNWANVHLDEFQKCSGICIKNYRFIHKELVNGTHTSRQTQATRTRMQQKWNATLLRGLNFNSIVILYAMDSQERKK